MAASLLTHKPELYNKNANFVYSDAATAPVVSMLNLQPGERVLDIGCGSGELTVRLLDLVGDEGDVWGTDSNADMLDAAVAKSKKLEGKVFQSDAQDLQLPEGFERSFDKVFTNATLHWCKRDPAGVIKGAKRALKEGGSFVGEFGGFQNVAAVRSHMHQILRERGIDPIPLDPWYFPTAHNYAALLASEGFTVVSSTLVPRPTLLPTDLLGWMRTFARRSFLSSLSDEEAEDVMKETSQRSLVDCRDEDGRDSIMYVRLRFEAHL